MSNKDKCTETAFASLLGKIKSNVTPLKRQIPGRLQLKRDRVKLVDLLLVER